ncbi:MAG: hypothetical protein VR70_01635 [Rhodospirillaceae bacterium BRH_c57]|nr:MAG: hypothetical protein VR70_01635 [Rhodospirillaceae bacterium BRH_c57]
MTGIDFSPLNRSCIGFERLARAAKTAGPGDSGAFPPYDIVKTGSDAYAVTLAVAGFDAADLDIEVNDAVLTITGRKQADAPSSEGAAVLYRGIAQRDFMRRFHLADHVKVSGAALSNGLLTVTLAREVPKAVTPRTVPITTARAA